MSLDDRRIERRVRRYEFPLMIGLVITWMALWRDISLLSAISGFAVAGIITRVFYLPPVEIAGRFNVWYAARYLWYFLSRVIFASLQVSWIALRPKAVPKCAIIEVKLRTSSDFILTLTGMTISLIPGSFIVDVDRDAATLFLHVLNTPDQASIDSMLADVGHIESLLIRTLGTKEEVRAL